jgi:alpha-galactosidase
MGWNDWYQFTCEISDPIIRAAADRMVNSGMRAAGYEYLDIDDCWQGNRDAKGFIHPNARFPDMKALAGYVHSKGLKFGLYSSPGPKTCQNLEGSYGHEEKDGWELMQPLADSNVHSFEHSSAAIKLEPGS